jgi:hypothetical protein
MARSLSGLGRPRAGPVSSAAVKTVTSLIELAVGVGCVAGGIVVVRSRRWIGAVLLVAGFVAIAHAVVELL